MNPASIRASFERSDSEPRAWRALFCFSPFSGERDLRHVHLAVGQHAEAHSDGAGLLARNVALLWPVRAIVNGSASHLSSKLARI